MNKELRSAMFKRNKLRNTYYKNRSKNNWDNYKKQRNLVTSIRRKSIKTYFKNKCSNTSNSKDFWKAIKPFLNDKNCKGESNTIILNENGQVICDPRKVCSIFNDFFTDIANSIGKSRVPIDMSKPESINLAISSYKDHPSVVSIKQNNNIDRSFNFYEVTPQYVRQKIRKLNPKKAAGPDDLPPKLIKMVCNELSYEMCDIINRCIRNSIFPDDMKYANISPLYKKKDLLLKNNYRPVNVISVLAKLFEIILAEQLGLFFSDLFSDFLSAYRKRHSCQNSLLYMTDAWREALDSNMYVGAVLMDLSKAFDCLPPDLFISKLYAYSVSSPACKLMASYLSRRKQRVKIGMERSSWRETVKGVPQGSGLGPLIFNIFMNDIFYFIKDCKIMNYADDNTIYTFHHNVDHIINTLQSDSKQAVEWFEINFMEANPTKFQFIFLSPSRKKQPLMSTLPIFDINIDRCEYVKLLGVTIDDQLNFHNNIKDLCKKASRQLNAFKRISNNLSIIEREMIYNSFIVSVFNYCPLIWHFCKKSDHRKVEKINERALRVVYNDYNKTYDELLQIGNKMSLRKHRFINFAIESYKIKRGESVDMLKCFDVPKITPYDLRCKDQNTLPSIRTTTYGIKSFRYLSSHIWNLLPDNIKQANDLPTFKTLIQQWPGSNCKCSLCDDL
jgi:hypothetical protein